MSDKKVDPVSGNEIPFGAVASEVRDDIPIMASENEFVIPANVVRFIGLEKIQKMVDKAKEALEAMGEVIDEDANEGNPADLVDNDFPFDPSELMGADSPEIPEGFAEGGLIGESWVWPEGNGIKEFKNSQGMIMYIPFNNGQPVIPVPAGYSENPQGGVVNPEDAPDPLSNVASPVGGMQPLMSQDNSADENDAFVDKNKSVFSGNPSDWKVSDFVEFGNKQKGPGDIAVKGVVGMLPGGKMAMKARESWLNSEVATIFDDMITTGVDPQGNKINPQDMTNLINSKKSLMEKMDSQTGMGLNPADSLMSAVTKFNDFITGKKSVVPTAPTKQNDNSTGSPKSSLNNAGTKMTSSYANQGFTKSEADSGGFGVGSDMGKTGPTTGSISSGGLYAKGGLITRKIK